MSTKRKIINFCIDRIYEILNEIRPGNNWTIIYSKPEEIELDDWKKQYLGIINGEDYFFIYIDHSLTYAVNVTGDSILTAVQELINKLAIKF